MKKQISFCASAILYLTASSTLCASEFIPLGFLSNSAGFKSSMALGVDASGQKVVGIATLDGELSAFLWQSGTGIQPLNPTDQTVTANAISADGTTVVGRARTVQSANGESYVTSAGQGSVPGSLGTSELGSGAEDVSADGGVVVGWSATNSTPSVAYRWTTQAGFEPLGYLDEISRASIAMGISSDGTVIVGQSNTANGPEAFRWTSINGMIGIGDLPGGNTNSIAFDASANGNIIVGAGESSSQLEEAFRWQAGSGMIGLGHLANTYARSIAFATTSDGASTVGVSGLTSDDLTAFVWDASHGMRSLQEVIIAEPNLTGNLSGWRLATAYDISASGRAIVGWGYNPQGEVEGWLVRLDQPINTPEPAAVGLLSVAGAVALALCRTRRRPLVAG